MFTTAEDLDAMPEGAVIHAMNVPDLAWIKTADGRWANYSNWPAPPTDSAHIIRLTPELMRGTAVFEK